MGRRGGRQRWGATPSVEQRAARRTARGGRRRDDGVAPRNEYESDGIAKTNLKHHCVDGGVVGGGSARGRYGQSHRDRASRHARADPGTEKEFSAVATSRTGRKSTDCTMPAISSVTPCCVKNGSSNASSHASSTPCAMQYTLRGGRKRAWRASACVDICVHVCTPRRARGSTKSRRCVRGAAGCAHAADARVFQISSTALLCIAQAAS